MHRYSMVRKWTIVRQRMLRTMGDELNMDGESTVTKSKAIAR